MNGKNAFRTKGTEKYAVTFTLFTDCQMRNQVSLFLMKCHNTTVLDVMTQIENINVVVHGALMC